MNRTRSVDTVPQSTIITSISSHVPLVTTPTTNDAHIFMQPLTNKSSTTTIDVQSLLQSLPMTSNRDTKRRRTVCQPKGTIIYKVGDRDTLEKVALRFNSTPSELLQLNKLNTRIVFPGQVLFVPEASPIQQATIDTSTSSRSSSSTTTKDADAFFLVTDRRKSRHNSLSSLSHIDPQQDVGSIVWSLARESAARPGRAQRESSSSTKTIEDHQNEQTDQVKILQKSPSIEENHGIDDECLKRFIKVNAQLMTEDRKSVTGTLLVTPNAVMFDPDLLNPLVKQHGIDKYGLIIRMNQLAGIALYEDLAMYEYGTTSRDEEKRQMYYSSSIKHLSQDLRPSIHSHEGSVHAVMSGLLDQIEQQSDPSSSTEPCCVLFNATSAIQRQQSMNTLIDHFDDDTFLPAPTSDDDSLTNSNDLCQPLDDYKHSIGILSDDDINLVNKNFNRVPSQGYYLENNVPVDQFHRRFDEIDKLLHEQQQKYFAPHPIEIPYYLRLKINTHIHESSPLKPRQCGKTSDDEFSDRKLLEREYWFCIPKDKAASFYSFFLRWTPDHQLNSLLGHGDLSSSLDHSSSKQPETNPGQGFVLLANEDPELTGDSKTLSVAAGESDQNSKESHYLKRQNTLLKEWEIISVDEIYRRFNSIHSNSMHNHDAGIPAPTLLQLSTLINEEQSKKILLELPARLHGLDWHLTFSTEAHGFSLNQLYRHSVEFNHDYPSLLIVKDVDQHMFGAFIPHQLMISERFYGTGESFLFTFYPEFRVFNWSCGNEFFVRGDLHALGFGSGEYEFEYDLLIHAEYIAFAILF